MIRRILPLMILVLLLVVFPVMAQSTPNWPDWVFTGDWPPGTYPVEWVSAGRSYPGEITVQPDGTWVIGNYDSPVPSPYTAECGNADCSELHIAFLAPGQVPGSPSESLVWIRIRWDEWTPILPTTNTPPPGTTTPTTTTPVPPTATPTPEPLDCPDPVIEQRLPPLVERIGIEPPNPVVVGQGGQGLVVRFRVTSFPVIRHWWEAKSEETTACVHVETGFVDDGRYGVSPCAAGWPGWETRTVRREWCEEHIEIIPDPIRASGFMVHARLREQSKQWIRGELRTRYPGADIQHPDWDVPGVTTVNGCLS